jgi:hypothetical protein
MMAAQFFPEFGEKTQYGKEREKQFEDMRLLKEGPTQYNAYGDPIRSGPPGIRYSPSYGGADPSSTKVMRESIDWGDTSPKMSPTGLMPESFDWSSMPQISLAQSATGATGLSGGAGQEIDPSQSTLSPNFAPYVYDMLSRGQGLASLPYQEYTGQRYAGPSGLQNLAFQRYQNLQAPSQFGEATGIARLAAERAGGMGYYMPEQFSPERVAAERVNTPQVHAFQMQAPSERVTSESFVQPGTAQSYMSPYMQAVVDKQSREAIRQSDIARGGRGARYAQAGAFGGARQAIENAEAERNLQTQLGDIQATGSQFAFQQAQQQFNQEQQARQAAQQANLGAGLTVGGQNLAAQLGVQQLGTQTGLEAQRANQTTGLQAALANQQYGLQGQNLAEQSRQFGANLGLQGIGQQLGAGQLMSGIGTQAGQFGLQGLQGLLGAGATQQQFAQQPLDFGYQQFQESMKYPYQQTTYMQSLLQGLPLQARAYDAGQSGLASALSGGLSGLALYNLLNPTATPK